MLLSHEIVKNLKLNNINYKQLVIPINQIYLIFNIYILKIT
jgi:hypothetical protein